MKKVGSEENLADALTKAVSGDTLKEHAEKSKLYEQLPSPRSSSTDVSWRDAEVLA